MVDDMIDTYGTMDRATNLIIEEGATEVHIVAIHPILSGKALDLIVESPVKSIVTTDTISLSEEAKACGKIKVASAAPILAKAIKEIHSDGSLRSMFQ